MFLRYKYNITFYLPYELYVLFKANGNLKYIIEQEINKYVLDKHSKSIQIKKITENLFLITVKVKEHSAYQKIKEILLDCKELLPPWITFPNMFQGSPRWNQGYEEDYCCNCWIPYWKSLKEDEKSAYYVKHNAPQEWIDWLGTFVRKYYK